MPNFKPKSKKKIKFSTDYITTLDFKHQAKMAEFADIKINKIPKLKQKKKKSEKKIN